MALGVAPVPRLVAWTPGHHVLSDAEGHIQSDNGSSILRLENQARITPTGLPAAIG